MESVPPSLSLNAANDKLREARQGANAGDLPKTRQASSDAQDSLDEAQRNIKAALEETEDAFRDERITRLRQSVREFLARQQRLIDETQQAETQRQAGDQSLNPLWRQTVQDLAGDQVALSQDVGEAASSLSDVVTFAFALQRVAQEMLSAGQLIGVCTTRDLRRLNCSGRLSTSCSKYRKR